MVVGEKEKFDPLKFEGVTGWDALGVKLAVEEGANCIVVNGELWREDMGVYYGKVKRIGIIG